MNKTVFNQTRRQKIQQFPISRQLPCYTLLATQNQIFLETYPRYSQPHKVED